MNPETTKFVMPTATRPGLFDADNAARPALRPAVFVDKNGTLILEQTDNLSPELIRFAPRALEGMKALSEQGFALVVVTSEPGLGLGLVNRATLSNVEHTISRRLRDEAGIELAGFYTCPHKPGMRGEPACLCRVPAPGLLRQAALSLRLDPAQSWMVGDVLNDVEAGRRVGCRTVLVESGSETNWRMSPLRTPHHRGVDLLDASRIISQSPAASSSLELGIELAGAVAPRDLARSPAPPASYVAAHMARPAPTAASRSPALRIGPLQGFEPHPTREWL